MGTSLHLDLAVDPERAGRPEDLTARCRLVNAGEDEAVVNLSPLSSPSLALELTDDTGQAVLLPPPPVPPAEPPTATLGPGEERTVEFTGFLPSWTPPGRFRARFRYVAGRGAGRWVDADLRSDWVEFRLDPGAPAEAR